MASSVRFEYRGQKKGVILFPGMNVEELKSILKNVFSLTSDIIGFVGQEEVIIPISLACQNPQILPSTGCEVITGGIESLNPSVGSTGDTEETEIEVATGEILRFITGLKERNIITEEQAELLEDNLNESNLLFAAYSVAVSANDIEYFANMCKDIAHSMESDEGRSACEAQDEVLQLADELYISTKITENQLLYLRHLILIREETVADIYDDFQNGKITTLGVAKALYQLANLHPVKTNDKKKDNTTNNVSTTSTPNRKNKGNRNRPASPLIKSFNKNTSHTLRSEADSPMSKYLSSMSPLMSQMEKEQKRPQSATVKKDNSTTTMTRPQTAPTGDASRHRNKQKSSTNTTHQLSDVVVSMIDSKLLTSSEAEILIQMIRQKNEIILGAFELYLENYDQNDLTDTLLRCVRLEQRKRDIESTQRVLLSNAATLANTASTSNDNDDEDDDVADDEDYQAIEDLIANTNDALLDDDDDEDEEEEEEDDDDDIGYNGQPKSTTATTGTTSVNNDALLLDDEIDNLGDVDLPVDVICSLLHIENTWKSLVPASYLSLIFNAVYRKQLSVQCAMDAANRYVTEDEYIHAVWQVYQLQKDKVDLIDSIRRITRIEALPERPSHEGSASTRLNFSSNPSNTTPTSINNTNSTTTNTTAAASRAASRQLYEQKSQLEKELYENQKEKEKVLQSKESAMNAIKEAKHELLTHSLDMMLKSNILTVEQVNKLIVMSKDSYSLVDAVIDNYAANRNVTDFMKSLQMLASYADGDLDYLLSSKNESATSKSHLKPSTTTTTSTTNVTNKRKNATSLEGDDDETLLTREQIELSQIVLELHKANIITDQTTHMILEAIKEGDQTLLDSYETFLVTRNFDTFVEALLSYISSPTKPTTTNTTTTAAASTSTPVSADSLSLANNQKAVLDILLKANVITSTQSKVVNTLIDHKNKQVDSIFTKYEMNKDLSALIDGLKLLKSNESSTMKSSGNTVNSPSATTANNNNTVNPTNYSTYGTQFFDAHDDDEEDEDEDEDDDNIDEENNIGENGHHGYVGEVQNIESDNDEDDGEEGDEEEEDEYDEADEGGLDEDDRGYIEGKFLEIIQTMQLTPLETSALRLAISRDDELIRDALAQFRVTLNEQQLIDRLKDIVQVTLTEIKKSQEDFIPDNDSETGENISPRRGVSDDEMQPNPSGNTGVSNDNDDEDDQDADEEDADEDPEVNYGEDTYEDDDGNNEDDDEEEEEEEEEEEPSHTTSQAARNHVFPILVKELIKESILSTADGTKILSLFQQGSTAVNKALDHYDNTHDMGVLVDTLESISSASK